ncbi:MAG: RNA polymerase sigma-70 factor [Odoribacteraceae bacterium]|jgi:RNA polymerase sigma-70 factor (ECF subfamily)|nr:RNA polymerase sigma-70 factor [Odoribacteraceae bacterium]
MEEKSTPPANGKHTRENDPSAKIQDLFIRYYASLISFARRYVMPDTAEDLVQDVFVRLWEDHERLSRLEDLPAYIYQMVRHRCLNHIRNEKTRVERAKQYMEAWDEEEIGGFIEEETFRLLMESIEELPPACRAILSLGLQGHKAHEIAARLNLAISTVKKQKQIARQILRRKLGLLVLYTGGYWLRVLKFFS